MKKSAPKHFFAPAFAALFLATSMWAESPKKTTTQTPTTAASNANDAQASKPSASAKQAPQATSDGYVAVGFDQLAGFPFTAPPIQPNPAPVMLPKPNVLDQIPDDIRKLDGQNVTVTGFMLPVKIEKGLATEFLLLNSPMMCCYGVTPSTNAWVMVKMPKGVPPLQDAPLPFRGRLHVRAQWDNGWLSSVYQLDGESGGGPRS
jgi:hypothetical protein